MHQHGSGEGLSSEGNQRRIKEIFVCTNWFCRSTATFECMLNQWLTQARRQYISCAQNSWCNCMPTSDWSVWRSCLWMQYWKVVMRIWGNANKSSMVAHA